ncbi:MAG: DUF2726 domain-containing protein [Mariprofundaceae bacterium]|nr:DUF2726 domain-containing protein [Mariprofundaceae bacterium]
MSKRFLLRAVCVVVMTISLSGCIQEPVSTSQKVRSTIPSSPSLPEQPVNHSQKKTEVRRYNEKTEEEDNKDKLTIIENFDYYEAKQLQNHSEIQVYWALVDAISSLNPKVKLSVCPQVSLGAYIQTPKGSDEKYKKEYWAMASLRPDFVIVSTANFHPIAVVDFNGGGHDSKNDPKKRLVLKKIGIPYIEISDFKEINHSVKSKFRHYIEKEVVPIIVRGCSEKKNSV